MTDFFQENKRSLFLLTGLLMMLAIVLFFFVLRPFLLEVSNQTKVVTDKRVEKAALEAQVESMNGSLDEQNIDQLKLENKIPTDRKLDEYILSIQQLELVTGSKVDKVEFVYDSKIEEEEEEVPTEPSTIIPPQENTVDEEREEEEVQIDPVILAEKPEALQLIIVRIEAASPNFDDFIALLKEIEKQERISIVSTLTFKKPTEYETVFPTKPAETIHFEAELTTFYYTE